ncbi:hypothetical protein [Pseudomarimonas arenosa]|uniref:Capsule assembly protein Wzi n=1 Tax=Pseudomarimonas arenosa TaxID=2774145 RepID=A0AAW3ZTH5_9GAMM|nr:hypothetical protein [Pseudomarimonas arenosa]MBD8528115.1 hypothetical protein [Pseudomarimonas arenosa]
MQTRQIISWLFAASFATGAAQAGVHTVQLTVDPAIVPDIVASENAGDFLLAYSSRGGVNGNWFNDGVLGPAESLHFRTLGRFDYATPHLAFKPGYGVLLSFEETTRPDSPFGFPVMGMWLKHLNASLSGPAPREVDIRRGLARPSAFEMDLLSDTRSGRCCTLLAYSHPWNGWLGLELMSGNGEALANRKDLQVDGSADLRVRNPAIAYQSDAGFFAVAYETRRDIRVRLVYPTLISASRAEFKWISGDYVVANKTQPARYESLVDGHPSIAYSAELRQFLVTWLDHTQSTGERRRVMARALTRGGLPSGSTFTVQSSCAVGSWTCLLTRPAASGAPQVFAFGGGFQLSFAAMPWNQLDRQWGVLGHRVNSSGSGFTISTRWLTPISDAEIGSLRTAYDPRSGIAAATWLATTRSVGDRITIENTSLLISDFLP